MEIDFSDIRGLRKQNNMNQVDFWKELGVTQSGGSRYESGRTIPKPIKKLLVLRYSQGVDVASVQV